jgi:hypothetical protein
VSIVGSLVNSWGKNRVSRRYYSVLETSYRLCSCMYLIFNRSLGTNGGFNFLFRRSSHLKFLNQVCDLISDAKWSLLTGSLHNSLLRRSLSAESFNNCRFGSESMKSFNSLLILTYNIGNKTFLVSWEKGWGTVDELIQEACKGPPVWSLGVRLVHEEFRRHVL